MTDGGQDIEHHPDGFTSGDHDHVDHSPDYDWTHPVCTEDGCTERGMDVCGCCGHHLCARHDETQGGFCSNFTEVVTEEFGAVPCCPRVLGGDLVVHARPQLRWPARDEETERLLEADIMTVQNAVEAEMPAWQVGKVREALGRVTDAVDEQSPVAVACETADTDLCEWCRAAEPAREDLQLARALTYVDEAWALVQDDQDLALAVGTDLRDARDLLVDAVEIAGGETDV